MKKKMILGMLCLLFIMYTFSLFYISNGQNVYNVEIQMISEYYAVSQTDARNVFDVPVIIKNYSNRTVSSQLNIALSYHLYRVNDETQELISIENMRSVIPNVYPGDKQQVNLQFEIPLEKGTYILYADLIEENTVWYSECGMLAPYVYIEVY